MFSLDRPGQSAQPPTILAVFAHPDDESFLVGGTLAFYARCGFKVKLLCLTAGDQGENALEGVPGSRGLSSLREEELKQACRVLGVEVLPVFHLPDGKLAEVGTKIIGRLIAQVIYQVQPDMVITFGPDGLTGHPDHIATCHATTLAFNRAAGMGATLFYSSLSNSVVERLSSRMEGNLGDRPLGLVGLSSEELHVQVDIKQFAAYKWAALECHRSQVGSFATLTPSDFDLLGQAEYFRLARVAGLRLSARPAPTTGLFWACGYEEQEESAA